MKFSDPEKQQQVERLIEENADFKELYQEHYLLSMQVLQLEDRKSLTSEEQMDLSRLKKIKLSIKDKMSAILLADEG